MANPSWVDVARLAIDFLVQWRRKGDKTTTAVKRLRRRRRRRKKRLRELRKRIRARR